MSPNFLSVRSLIDPLSNFSLDHLSFCTFCSEILNFFLTSLASLSFPIQYLPPWYLHSCFVLLSFRASQFFYPMLIFFPLQKLYLPSFDLSSKVCLTCVLLLKSSHSSNFCKSPKTACVNFLRLFLSWLNTLCIWAQNFIGIRPIVLCLAIFWLWVLSLGLSFAAWSFTLRIFSDIFFLISYCRCVLLFNFTVFQH